MRRLDYHSEHMSGWVPSRTAWHAAVAEEVDVTRETKDMLIATGRYFGVFFLIMLGYRFFDATIVKHVAFEFDLRENLLVPAFAGIVGGFTNRFGTRRL